MYYPPHYIDQETSKGVSRGSWRNEATEYQGLASEHKVLIILQELQKKCEMISKIILTQNMEK